MHLNTGTISSHRLEQSPAFSEASGPPAALGRQSDRGRGLRILLVVESSAAGTGRHVLDLAEGLIARGCEVHMVYSTVRIDRLFSERLTKIPKLQRLAVSMRRSIHPSDLSALRAVRRYVREAGPFDVIHGHSSKGGALARLGAIGTKTCAFYTVHGLIMLDPRLARWKWVMYLWIEIGLSFRTARIIAVSPEESRAAVRLGFGKARVIMIPNGVGPAKLTPRMDARHLLGVTEDALVVGFVGRLVEEKAPDVLIRAFASLLRAAPHARLALVGGGPIEASLHKLATDLAVEDKIIWLGERDARGVFAAFDIFAIASRREGLPYVVLEAMAAGLPVVATSTSGVEILIDPGVSGTVVPPDDPNALATALVDLALNPQRLSDFGRASLQRSSQFTIDRMVDQTLDAYLSVARSGEIS